MPFGRSTELYAKCYELSSRQPMPELQEIQASPANSGKAESPILTSPRQRTLFVGTLLAVGFLLRVWHASGTFLNSDEVMHFAAANQTSWLETYRASLSLSHPPLLIFILHA